MNAIELAFRNAQQTRHSASTSQNTRPQHGMLPKVLLAVQDHSTCVLVSTNLEQAGIDVIARADSPGEIARCTKACSPELLVIDDHLHRFALRAAPARQVVPLPAVLLVSGERDETERPTTGLMPAMGAVGAPFSARNCTTKGNCL